MAYVSQELKKSLAPAIKRICQKHGIKATLAVRHHSTLVLNIKAGKIDFFSDYELQAGRTDSIQVNPYHYNNHFSGKSKKFLSEIIPLMNKGNHDNSDIQTDYFDVGWYVDVNIGQWNQPYIFEKV
jgi:hypothetical protein